MLKAADCAIAFLGTRISGVEDLPLSCEMIPAFNPVCQPVKGNHREEILRLAVSLEADLVVVGATARSGITALIVESTAEILAKDLNCSVLVVKPPGFVAPIAN